MLLSENLSVLVGQHLAGKLSTAAAFKTPRIDAFARMLRKDCQDAHIETTDGFPVGRLTFMPSE